MRGRRLMAPVKVMTHEGFKDQSEGRMGVKGMKEGQGFQF